MMNKATLLLFSGSLLGAGLSNPAVADFHVEDTFEFFQVYFVHDLFGYPYADGAAEVHTIDFAVLSSSNVQLDMLSFLEFDAFMDTRIMLFTNDGNPLSYTNLIFENDDYPNSDMNGSHSSLDPFLDVFLTAGDYTVAIGAHNMVPGNAESGACDSRVLSVIDTDTAMTGAQYHFDIYGDVTPTPSALALLVLGGLVGSRRRR